MSSAEPDFHLVIQDANIIIDLHNAGILEQWFELGIATITSDMVEQELQAGSQWEGIKNYIEKKNLEIIQFTAEEVLQIYTLKRQCSVSLPDCSVMFLSQKKASRLLTGDRKLRRLAEGYNIQCAGILWVFDLLIDRGAITRAQATTALRHMIDEGSRLPMNEVDKRLDLWAKM